MAPDAQARSSVMVAAVAEKLQELLLSIYVSSCETITFPIHWSAAIIEFPLFELI